MPANTEFIPCAFCCGGTTTTTTTLAPSNCQCEFPGFLPENMCEYQELITNCVVFQYVEEGPITGSTTLQPCPGSCLWKWGPYEGFDCSSGSPDGWELVSNDCNPSYQCTCNSAPPVGAPAPGNENQHNGTCVYISNPSQPCPGSNIGDCGWTWTGDMWIPFGSCN